MSKNGLAKLLNSFKPWEDEECGNCSGRNDFEESPLFVPFVDDGRAGMMVTFLCCRHCSMMNVTPESLTAWMNAKNEFVRNGERFAVDGLRHIQPVN